MHDILLPHAVVLAVMIVEVFHNALHRLLQRLLRVQVHAKVCRKVEFISQLTHDALEEGVNRRDAKPCVIMKHRAERLLRTAPNLSIRKI